MFDQNDSPFSLAEIVERRVRQLLKNGFHFPITGFAMDESGNFVAWRQINDDVEGCRIAEHYETGSVLIAPVSVVLLDGTPGHIDYFVTPSRSVN
jgi:hypothetical protein